MRVETLAVSAALVLGVPPALAGQRLEVTLPEAVRRALDVQPAMVQARGDQRNAGAGQRAAFGAFLPTITAGGSSNLASATARLKVLLNKHRRVLYENALAHMLELPLVWESDVKRITMDLFHSGEIDIRGLKRRERTPKKGYVLARKT